MNKDYNFEKLPLDNSFNAFCKRTADIIGAVLLLIFCSPIFLICSIGVKISSYGSILFKQVRVGINGKPFVMYKFRSLIENDEENTAWTGKYDNRRTVFGAFMRKYSLDETPQLVNVLKGEMSLVGPRPEIPYFVEKFSQKISNYMFRHHIRPGITGWAQINDFRGDSSIEKRTEYDIFYIKNWSLFFDIKILFITVFKGKFINDEVPPE